jgi:translation elongation factor EF-Tu-like GTPase
MIATLLDVFEISGRGCVVALDVESGDCKAGDELRIGSRYWLISGIDIPRYSPETLRRREEGWKPPLGVLLKGADRLALAALIGETVSTRSPEDGGSPSK